MLSLSLPETTRKGFHLKLNGVNCEVVLEGKIFATSSCDVFKASLETAPVVVKVVSDRAMALREERNYRVLAKQHVVATVNFFGMHEYEDGAVALVLEMARRDLYSLFEKTLPFHTAFKAGRGMIKCVANLHACGWVHNDVSLENFVLRYKKDVKFIDLAFARKAPLTVHRRCGKVRYMHPRLYANEMCNPFVAECYSLGMCLWYATSQLTTLYDLPDDACSLYLQKHGLCVVVKKRKILTDLPDHLLLVIEGLLEGSITATDALAAWKKS